MKFSCLVLVVVLGFCATEDASTAGSVDVKAVPSVEFKSEKSEIEFGGSDPEEFPFEARSTYDEGNEIADVKNSSIPEKVFLSLRNISNEAALRNFKDRNDVVDLEASATDNLPDNSSAPAVNLRISRDTNDDLTPDASAHLFTAFKHKKIDTAELSDCALQGEWQPMGAHGGHGGHVGGHRVHHQLALGTEHHQEAERPDRGKPFSYTSQPQVNWGHGHFEKPEHVDVGSVQLVQTKPKPSHFAEDFLSPPPMPQRLVAEPPKPHRNKYKQKKVRPSYPKPYAQSSITEVKLEHDNTHQASHQGAHHGGQLGTHQGAQHGAYHGTHYGDNFVNNGFGSPEDSSSFTCGKNHDHGTKFHTASFQVVGDDGDHQQDADIHFAQESFPQNVAVAYHPPSLDHGGPREQFPQSTFQVPHVPQMIHAQPAIVVQTHPQHLLPQETYLVQTHPIPPPQPHQQEQPPAQAEYRNQDTQPLETQTVEYPSQDAYPQESQAVYNPWNEQYDTTSVPSDQERPRQVDDQEFKETNQRYAKNENIANPDEQRQDVDQEPDPNTHSYYFEINKVSRVPHNEGILHTHHKVTPQTFQTVDVSSEHDKIISELEEFSNDLSGKHKEEFKEASKPYSENEDGGHNYNQGQSNFDAEFHSSFPEEQAYRHNFQQESLPASAPYSQPNPPTSFSNEFQHEPLPQSLPYTQSSPLENSFNEYQHGASPPSYLTPHVSQSYQPASRPETPSYTPSPHYHYEAPPPHDEFSTLTHITHDDLHIHDPYHSVFQHGGDYPVKVHHTDVYHDDDDDKYHKKVHHAQYSKESDFHNHQDGPVTEFPGNRYQFAVSHDGLAGFEISTPLPFHRETQFTKEPVNTGPSPNKIPFSLPGENQYHHQNQFNGKKEIPESNQFHHQNQFNNGKKEIPESNQFHHQNQFNNGKKEIPESNQFHHQNQFNNGKKEIPESFLHFQPPLQHHKLNLPIAAHDIHPPKHDKPKVHKAPKRKPHTKQYEVHETSGERQTPLSAIFPPKKMPKQFDNRLTPNFAVNRPKKGKKPIKPPQKPGSFFADASTLLQPPPPRKNIKRRPSKPIRSTKTATKLKNRPITDKTIKVNSSLDPSKKQIIARVVERQ